MIDFGGQVGLSIEKASLLATAHGLGQVVGVLVIMLLSDYLGRKKPSLLMSILATITICFVRKTGN